MSALQGTLVAFIVTFMAAMLIAPISIKWLKALKAKQTILEYVTQHSDKSGIPTMGGLIFLLAAFATAIALGAYRGGMALVFISIVFAFGVVGFLDDFLKVKRGKNQGLKAYQKILFQSAVAVTATVYCARNPSIGTAIELPFTDATLDLGYAYIPFGIFAFLGMTNAVNLTDGLDGLAGSTSAVYYATFIVLLLSEVNDATKYGSVLYEKELSLLLLPISALVGGVMAFLWFNNNRASVFMGDTGSLALGGGAGAMALFTKNPLASLLIGIVFVWSCLSVIIQVIAYKTRKKRVFLMAPFHHHLELKGYNEGKIVGFYTIITVLSSALALLIR